MADLSAAREERDKRTGRPRTATRTPRQASEASSFASSAGVRSRMQQQRTRDTKPELEVRRRLHAAGLRYRVDVIVLPDVRRRADIVFGGPRVAVYVDGCFWHGCPDHGNPRPASNGWYWPDKIARNRERDADTDRRLRDAGWEVIRVWEHDPADQVAVEVEAVVRRRRSRARPDQRHDSPS